MPVWHFVWAKYTRCNVRHSEGTETMVYSLSFSILLPFANPNTPQYWPMRKLYREHMQIHKLRCFSHCISLFLSHSKSIAPQFVLSSMIDCSSGVWWHTSECTHQLVKQHPTVRTVPKLYQHCQVHQVHSKEIGLRMYKSECNQLQVTFPLTCPTH